METKLKSVLLIDDDNITNFMHKTILRTASISDQINIAETVTQALDLLKVTGEQHGKGPELIFLDLNMPGQTGWDFVEAYKMLKGHYHLNSVIIILSASANPDDYHKANQISEVAEFRNKPMTSAMVDEIISKHFSS